MDSKNTLNHTLKKVTIFAHLGKQLIKLYLIVFISSVYGAFMSYNYKEFGETVTNNDHVLTLAGSLGCIFNSLGRIFWCIVFDYLSFRTILTILDCVLLVLCIFCTFVNDSIAFCLIVILTYFTFGSFYGLIPAQTFKICG